MTGSDQARCAATVASAVAAAEAATTETTVRVLISPRGGLGTRVGTRLQNRTLLQSAIGRSLGADLAHPWLDPVEAGQHDLGIVQLGIDGVEAEGGFVAHGEPAYMSAEPGQ